MVVNLGIDCGNAQVKGVNLHDTCCFPSLISGGWDKLSEIKNRKHVIYNGCDYTIGCGESNINKAKYFNDMYKIMILTAISELTGDGQDIVANITVGVPIDQFKNKSLRTKIKNTICSWKNQKIIVDGYEKNITINKADVWLESGILILNQQKYKDKKIVVVDIGGYTKNFIEFVYNEIGISKTENEGLLKLKESVYKTFKEDHNVELDLKGKEELFSCIKDKGTFYINGENVLLDKYYNHIKSYVNEIFNSLEKTFSISDKKILFMGGGSLELRSFIETFADFYNFKVLENGDFINAYCNYSYSTNVL